MSHKHCIFCGDEIPAPCSTSWSSVCQSPSNTTTPDTVGKRYHVFIFTAGVPSTPVETSEVKRGDPECGRTLDEEHRPLVCFVCGTGVAISFNFCLEHKDEYERLKTAEENLADYAKRYFGLFDQYRHAWLREMGNVIRPKHWEIDGFVLRARDIYEKAQLVDRIKRVMVKSLKDKHSAEEMFDEVFKMLAEDGRDKIPTN